MAGCKTDFLCTLLSPSILSKFCSHLNLRWSPLVLWSAFLIGFFTFFRTANFVPNFLDTFSSHFVLSRGSIMFTSSGALLTVTRTKTLVVPLPYIPGSPLPYVWAPTTYPLFTFTTTSNQLDCITANSVNTSIKCLASLVSLDPQDFSKSVYVVEALHSSSSAEFQLNSSNSEETGDLTLTCCIYACLWWTDFFFQTTFPSSAL